MDLTKTPQAEHRSGDRIIYVQPLTPGRVMVLTLSVLFVLGVVWFVIQVSQIVLVLIMGILVATAIEPFVNALRRRGISRGPVVLVIYGGLLGLLVVALMLLLPPLYEQAQALVTRAPEFLLELQWRIEHSPSQAVRTTGGAAIAQAIALYDRFLEDPPLQAMQVAQAAEFITSFFGLLILMASIMIVAYYWMSEKAIIKRLALSLIPIERRDRAHDMWDEIESKVGGWARGQVVLMLLIGVASMIAYSPLLFDLRFWFLLGIWAGLTELIPFIGPWLGGSLAAVVALTDSWQKAVLVVVFFVILQQIEGAVIVPRVMHNAVGLTPLSVILAVLVGGTILGPIGAILSIPVAAAVQVLVSGILRARAEQDRADPVNALRAPAVEGATTPTAPQTVDPVP